MSATGDWKPGDSRTIRDGFGQAIVELAERDERIVALTADLSEALRVHQFAQREESSDCQSGTFHNPHPMTAILIQHPLRDPHAHLRESKLSKWKCRETPRDFFV